MDKVLTRKLFRDQYLKSLSKQVSNFNKGGLASLRIHHFEGGGSADLSTGVDPATLSKLMEEYGPPYSEGQRQALLLAPIASALLTGTRQPGQSQLGAVASNVGAALPQVVNTSMQIKKLEDERITALTKAATVQLKSNWKAATEEDKQKLYAQGIKDISPNDVITVKKDLNGNIADYKKEYSQNEEVNKAVDSLTKLKLTKGGVENDIDNFLNYSAPYLAKSGGKDIPGFGYITSNVPQSWTEDKGVARALFQKIINTEIKDYAGTAVSSNELERQLKALGDAEKAHNPQAMVTQLLEMKQLFNDKRDAELAKYKDGVIQELVDKGVVHTGDLPGIYDNYKAQSPNLFNDPKVTTITKDDGTKVQYKIIGGRKHVLALTPSQGQPADPYVTPKKWLPVPNTK